MKEVNFVIQNSALEVSKGLFYILSHTKNGDLKAECKNMIQSLYEKEIIPAMHYFTSSSEKSLCI